MSFFSVMPILLPADLKLPFVSLHLPWLFLYYKSIDKEFNIITLVPAREVIFQIGLDSKAFKWLAW